MNKILIIKTGETFLSIYKSCGDFDDFIINQTGLSKDKFIVSSVYKYESIPEDKDIAAVIITGSHSMVTDREPWSTSAEEYLRSLEGKDIPILGICYGHQLICQAFGGTVGYHPLGKEFGTVSIKLTEQGKKDLLLGVLPDIFTGHVAHSQTVLKLPEGATLLAENSFEQHHAFVLHDNIWGVQFHPEFNEIIVKKYISEMEKELIKEGRNPDEIYKSVRENDYGKILLKRFIEIAQI